MKLKNQCNSMFMPINSDFAYSCWGETGHAGEHFGYANHWPVWKTGDVGESESRGGCLASRGITEASLYMPYRPPEGSGSISILQGIGLDIALAFGLALITLSVAVVVAVGNSPENGGVTRAQRITEIQESRIPRPTINIAVFYDSKHSHYLHGDWGLWKVDRNGKALAGREQYIFGLVQRFPISWSTFYILNGIDNFTPYRNFLNQRRSLPGIGNNNLGRVVCGFPLNSSPTYSYYNPSPFRIHQSQGVIAGSFRTNLGSFNLPPDKPEAEESPHDAKYGCQEVTTIERIARCLLGAAFACLSYWLAFRGAMCNNGWILIGFFVLGVICFVLGISILDSAFFGCGGWRHIKLCLPCS